MRTTPELFNMSEHVAVVTGGGRGIGEGIATSFAEAGAAVVVAARRTNEIEQVAASIIAAGGRAIAVTTDVTDDDAVEALAQAAVAEFGKLTVWVNNAGGSPLKVPAMELPREEWDRTLALNLTAVFVGSMTAARHMTTGSIINITSGAGSAPVPGSVHYGASKAGTNSVTWTLSAEFAPNIRVQRRGPRCNTDRGHAESHWPRRVRTRPSARALEHPNGAAGYTAGHRRGLRLPSVRRRELGDKLPARYCVSAAVQSPNRVATAAVVWSAGAKYSMNER